LAGALPQTPLGELTALPRSPSLLLGKGRKREKKGGKERKRRRGKRGGRGKGQGMHPSSEGGG